MKRFLSSIIPTQKVSGSIATSSGSNTLYGTGTGAGNRDQDRNNWKQWMHWRVPFIGELYRCGTSGLVAG